MALRVSTGENVGGNFGQIRQRKWEMVGGCDLRELETCMGVAGNLNGCIYKISGDEEVQVRSPACMWVGVHVCGFVNNNVLRGAGRCVG